LIFFCGAGRDGYELVAVTTRANTSAAGLPGTRAKPRRLHPRLPLLIVKN
jgi:hypothetical protein